MISMFSYVQAERFYVHLEIVCSFFSVLRLRNGSSSCSKTDPWGKGVFPGERDGSILTRHRLKIISTCMEVGTFSAIGNHKVRSIRVCGICMKSDCWNKNCISGAIVDQCQSGSVDLGSGLAYRKRSRFMASLLGLEPSVPKLSQGSRTPTH